MEIIHGACNSEHVRITRLVALDAACTTDVWFATRSKLVRYLLGHTSSMEQIIHRSMHFILHVTQGNELSDLKVKELRLLIVWVSNYVPLWTFDYVTRKEINVATLVCYLWLRLIRSNGTLLGKQLVLIWMTWGRKEGKLSCTMHVFVFMDPPIMLYLNIDWEYI